MYRWEIAERFGWTLAEVDALSMADLQELIQVDDGRIKAAQSAKKKGRKIA
jgi:hypothetical protein